MKEADNNQLELETKVAEVSQFLESHGIDTSTWGRGTKTVEHLAQEVLDGETELVETDEGEILRRVSFVNVDVRYRQQAKELQLMEDRQEFHNGHVRERGLIGISEKMKPGENIVEAASRGMKEEIGVDMECEFVDPEIVVKQGTSPSYPGLLSEYRIHRVRTYLPDSEFDPQGYIERQDDKDTYFVWKEVGSVVDPI